MAYTGNRCSWRPKRARDTPGCWGTTPTKEGKGETNEQNATRKQRGGACLEIELLGGGIIEGAAHDADDAVGQAQRLIELLRQSDHLVVLRGRV